MSDGKEREAVLEASAYLVDTGQRFITPWAIVRRLHVTGGPTVSLIRVGRILLEIDADPATKATGVYYDLLKLCRAYPTLCVAGPDAPRHHDKTLFSYHRYSREPIAEIDHYAETGRSDDY